VDDETAESAAVEGVSGNLLEVSVTDVLKRGKDVRYLSVHSLMTIKGRRTRKSSWPYPSRLITLCLCLPHPYDPDLALLKLSLSVVAVAIDLPVEGAES
jgi:hypothetical protein